MLAHQIMRSGHLLDPVAEGGERLPVFRVEIGQPIQLSSQ
jgi:hypothetical protein